MKHIVSFSGGKDSTAMLLMMLEEGMQIDEILFCDTGVEFPAMLRHIDKVEKYIGRPITRIKADKSFEYYLAEHVKTKGKNKGQVGYGWPDFRNRWCTSALKLEIIKRYLKKYDEYTDYIGIAYDEPDRANKRKANQIHPLVEWRVTEKEALQYCYDKGFYWEGLYTKFTRVSCYLCPLQRIGELRIIFNQYPELWENMKRLDKLSYRQFRADKSLQQIEDRFMIENDQCKINFEV